MALKGNNKIDYTAEITKLNNKITKLNRLREAEHKLSFPKIEGKYFRLAYFTYVKVLAVEAYDPEDNVCQCDVVVVCFDDSEMMSASIRSHETYYTVSLDAEITKEVFDKNFVKAMEIITKSV